MIFMFINIVIIIILLYELYKKFILKKSFSTVLFRTSAILMFILSRMEEFDTINIFMLYLTISLCVFYAVCRVRERIKSNDASK